MDMDAETTDELIAKAIASLPYRRPPKDFLLKVLAAIAAPRPAAWWGYTLKTAGFTVAAWEAVLCFCCARLVLSNLPEFAAFFIQPGGFQRAFRLLVAEAAFLAMKLKAGLFFLSDLAAAAGGFPAYYEIAAAALACAAVICSVSVRKNYSYGGS